MVHILNKEISFFRQWSELSFCRFKPRPHLPWQPIDDQAHICCSSATPRWPSPSFWKHSRTPLSTWCDGPVWVPHFASRGDSSRNVGWIANHLVCQVGWPPVASLCLDDLPRGFDATPNRFLFVAGFEQNRYHIRKITKAWQVVIAWRSVAGVMNLAPHHHDFDLQINWATHVTIIVHATELLSCVRVLITRHVECRNLENFGLMFELHTLSQLFPLSAFPLIWCTRSSLSPSTASLPPTTTISGNHCSTAPKHCCTPTTMTTTWHINRCATLSRWWRWSLSTSLKVSNPNSPSFFSFHIRHSSHIAVSDISINNKWMMWNKGQPGEPSDYPPLPFFNNGSRATLPVAMWQTTTIIQLPPTTPQQQWQCCITTSHHPQPYHQQQRRTANNNNNPQPPTNQDKPAPAKTDHKNPHERRPLPTNGTDYNKPRWGKLASSPPPIFLTWNQGPRRRRQRPSQTRNVVSCCVF